MGCDVLAPSDMMDGRVGMIRKSLDKKGFIMTQILSMQLNMLLVFMDPLEMPWVQKII